MALKRLMLLLVLAGVFTVALPAAAQAAENITIGSTDSGYTDTNGDITATADDAQVSASHIQGDLQANEAVSINTGTSGAQVGNITVDSDPDATSSNNGLTFNPAGAVQLDASTLTNYSGITFNGPVSLGTGTTVATAGGGVIFSGTVDGASSLTVNAGGPLTFSGAVGSNTALTSLSLTDSNGIAVDGGTIQTTGAQSFGGRVTLGQNANVTTTNSNVTFSGTVNGGFGLTANTGTGSLTLSGSVGNQSQLASLNLTAGAINLNGAGVATSGAQTYSGPVTLGQSTSVNTANSNVTFSGTVDGAFGLTVNAGTGTVTLGGAVGGTAPLTSLSLTAAGGSIALNGGSVTTSPSGDQTYSGPVTLGADATLAAGTGTVTFNSSVDSGSAGGQSLTVSSAGSVTISGNVGGTTPLTGLSTPSGTAVNLNGNVTTSDPQQYGGAVTLGINATLAGHVTFYSTVDGAQKLTISAGSLVSFEGAVGSVTPLTSLTLANGVSSTLGGNVTTTGVQSYGGAVTLGGDVTVTAGTGAAVTFASTVNGNADLTVSQAGSLSFGGTLGGTQALADVAVGNGIPTSLSGDVSDLREPDVWWRPDPRNERNPRWPQYQLADQPPGCRRRRVRCLDLNGPWQGHIERHLIGGPPGHLPRDAHRVGHGKRHDQRDVEIRVPGMQLRWHRRDHQRFGQQHGVGVYRQHADSAVRVSDRDCRRRSSHGERLHAGGGDLQPHHLPGHGQPGTRDRNRKQPDRRERADQRDQLHLPRAGG